MNKKPKVFEKTIGNRLIYTKINGDALEIPKSVPKEWYKFQPPNLPVIRPHQWPEVLSTDKEKECHYIAKYHGEPSPMGPNIYGGLIYAQALAVAQKEVDEEFWPTSFHGLYVGPSNTQKPMNYVVKRLRDGKSFSARYVEGLQDAKVVFSALGNFYKPYDPSMIHTTKMPDVPKPEECHEMYAFINDSLERHENGQEVLKDRIVQHLQRRYFDKETNTVEFRFVNPRRYFFLDSYKNVPVQYWFRSKLPLNDPKLPKIIHQIVISYVADQCMASGNVGPHLSHGHDAAAATSLDHTIWFHNFDFRADEWVLISAQSPSADSGTAFGHCSIWSHDGKFIASGGQESMARFKTMSKL
ncbi:unnamed protein product [Bursaphelenchus okinawaensis]|uniref:Uncharacterized protein n=1 Tax=Bursaphelenchus okinawaensis TaxID=465554 RepID=A0A811KR44_9BILA|nr:unnamed protein product [Bursaphelenchus okinawaensis]CAG9109438.1 unnamed protein product [Bursaphelenchus okinawaensis]